MCSAQPAVEGSVILCHSPVQLLIANIQHGNTVFQHSHLQALTVACVMCGLLKGATGCSGKWFVLECAATTFWVAPPGVVHLCVSTWPAWVQLVSLKLVSCVLAVHLACTQVLRLDRLWGTGRMNSGMNVVFRCAVYFREHCDLAAGSCACAATGYGQGQGRSVLDWLEQPTTH